jgi:acyl dehydratase
MTTSTDAVSEFDARLAEARARIGSDLRIEQYNHEATYDAIRHYAYGIGDDNPLWSDETYAGRGPFGTMVGPPTFFLSIFAPTLSPGLAGWQGFHAGGDYRWVRLARLGERITAHSKVSDVLERSGGNVNRFIIQVGETTYVNQDGETLAVFTTRHFRMPSKIESDGEVYKARPPREYSAEELEMIARDVFAQEVRGATPRYWEDVKDGDTLQPVVKGPLDRVSMICYYAGAMPASTYRPVDLAWRQRRLSVEHPELVPNNINPPTDVFQTLRGGSGHHDADRAHDAGMPGQYDNGHMRIGWTTHLITNWMGDTGTLKRLYTEIRRPNVIGNTTWFRGTVVDKSEDDDGDGVVEIEIEGKDQDGVVNTKGRAWVALPRNSS